MRIVAVWEKTQPGLFILGSLSGVCRRASSLTAKVDSCRIPLEEGAYA